MEGDSLSISDVHSSVAEILDNNAKPQNMVSERDEKLYVQLVASILAKDDNIFMETLKALSAAAFKMCNIFHVSLLKNIFAICIWEYDLDARNAILELIVNLAVIPDKFLEDCLEMLVRNFLVPEKLHHERRLDFHPHKQRVYGQLHEALCCITSLVPIAPLKLKDILGRRMPNIFSKKTEMVTFVECMLGLESIAIGEYLRSSLLSMVVELLVDLDANITWEDILKEDHNKGVFDMEEENLEDNEAYNSVDGQTTMGKRVRDKAEKLDGLMVIVCEHIKSSARDGRLVKAFETLMISFQKTMLNAYKSKISQFIMFYACSLDPEVCGLKFAIFLTDIFVSKGDPISRMSAVSYVASYLARARFISSSVVFSIIIRLVEWCYGYCLQAGSERINNHRIHRLFYAGFQAVMYVLCFRMRALVDNPELKSILFDLPLEAIICHPLEPLKVCLPTIVQEFLRQAAAAHLLKKPLMSRLQSYLLESEFSASFGGLERLDMFFPFDPYLLKESDRFMRPNYEFWIMVKKTYTEFNDDDEFDDLDRCSVEEAASSSSEDDENDVDDGLGYSMNNMSITPRPAYVISMADGHVASPIRMPGRIRPSVSPP